MSNLSELLPSGAGQNQVEFVASGALPNGQPVILKANGQVEVVADSSIAESIPAGSEAVLRSSGLSQIEMAFDPNTANKFVVVYQDGGNSDYGTATVGTISGTSISFGSDYVFNLGGSSTCVIAFDPSTANKFVVAYRDNSNSYYGTATVGTISDTSISFGNEYVFNTGSTNVNTISFDPNAANKFVIGYRDNGNSSYGTTIVGTVSGTSNLSFSAETQFNTSATTSFISISFDPNTANKFVVVYKDAGNSNYGTAKVGTLSGTSISYGSAVVFNAGEVSDNSVSFDPNNANKFVVVYRDFGNSSYGTAIIGTVSGTSISFGSEYVFNSAQTGELRGSFGIGIGSKFIATYMDVGSASNDGTCSVGTVSGTSISYGSKSVYNTGQANFNLIAFDPNNAGKFVIYYTSSGMKVIVGQVATPIATNLTATNLIGISAADVADTATAKINVWGGINSSVVPPAGALTTYAITVANASGNKYFIDTVQQDTPALTEGNTYKFDQSDSTNSGHPLRFSTTANGSHGGGSVYSSGVTVVGTPGNAGSYTQIVVPTDAPTLYYYCTAHSGMGSSVTTPAAAALIIGSDYYVHTDGSINTTTTGGQKIGTAISTTTINMKDLT